jgi:methylated-DNA-[protein]-cysteine S-methyltransferase
MTRVHEFPTPLGPMLAAADADGALVRLAFRDGEYGRDPLAGLGPTVRDAGPFARVVEQIGAYFRGELREFDLLLAPRGTPFQRRVWDELRRISFGATVSYRELAARVGSPAGPRAAGRANATNPLPVVVPCHRVVGADGSLTGYAGGLRFKRALLALEGAPGFGAPDELSPFSTVST